MDLFFNNDAVGIAETDADYKIIRANPVLCRMLGYAEEELLQRTWMDVVHPEDVQKAKDHFEPVFERAAGGTVLETRLRTKLGESRYVALNVQTGQRNEDGRPNSYIGFVMDIS
ncbi:MAG: PAS domain S-box protein, partial [Rhodospirillaceae bacterium]|nr:PAS domain S-box protein [Rhodospirillaceae bacterium]